MKPRVSVIIPTFNRASLLPRSVNSVLAQTFGNFEVIIVDDCSTDRTQETIAGFDDSRIRSLRNEKNMGQAAAINAGISSARGEYIAFLDDDDEWTPAKLERQVDLLQESHPDVALISGWSETVNDTTGKVKANKRHPVGGDVFEDTLALRPPGGTGVFLVRTSVAKEVGGFDKRYPFGKDANFICRIAQHYTIAVLQEVVLKSHVEHKYERITDRYWEISEFVKRHRADFSNQIDTHPNRSKILASTHMRVLKAELLLGNLYASLGTYVTALGLDPVGVVRSTIGEFPTLLKIFVWYATPFKHFRAGARSLREKLRHSSSQ